MNSRHLSYKFPPGKNPRIHLTGLYPSIGERLELPNDIEQKRPLNNPYAKTRLDFLSRYNLIDERDIQTWMRNKTYELESLSTSFNNAVGDPVGLGIYLVEYMRLMNIPIKPPLPPDDELKEDFDNAAKGELRWEIQEQVESQSPKEELKEMIEDIVNEKISEIIEQIFDSFLGDLEECLKEVGPQEIKYHINQQFEMDPGRDTYNLREIAHKLKTLFHVEVKWDKGEIIAIVKRAVESYIEELAEDLWDADIEFTPIHNETKTRDIYDMALAKMGAKPEDADKIREALAWRMNIQLPGR